MSVAFCDLCHVFINEAMTKLSPVFATIDDGIDSKNDNGYYWGVEYQLEHFESIEIAVLMFFFQFCLAAI